MIIVTRQARRIRRLLGLTLFDVGRDTGIRPDRLSRFEVGQRLMRYDGLSALAGYYSRRTGRLITIDELLAPDGDKATSSQEVRK